MNKITASFVLLASFLFLDACGVDSEPLVVDYVSSAVLPGDRASTCKIVCDYSGEFGGDGEITHLRAEVGECRPGFACASCNACDAALDAAEAADVCEDGLGRNVARLPLGGVCGKSGL